MGYRIAYNHDPDNPNPDTVLDLGSAEFATEAEARAAAEADDRDAVENGDYREDELSPWVIVLDSREVWTYVWETGDGPSLGGAHPTPEAAMNAAYEEWLGHEGGNLGGYDEGTREEFDAMYAESGDLWVVKL